MRKSFIEIIHVVEQELKALHYTHDTIRHYKNEWNRFSLYLNENGFDSISLETVKDYFFHRFNVEFDTPSKEHTRAMRSTVRALFTVLEFGKGSVIYRRRCAKEHKWPDSYENTAKEFMLTVKKNVSQSSYRQYRSHLECFIHFLMKNGCGDFGKLTPDLIKAYFSSRAHLKKTTLNYDTYVLRKLFDFLYDKGYNAVDFSVFVPNIKINAVEKIPSHYTSDELTILLKAVDRSSPIGKRDYAILLLALRYGMRAGDIRNLKLSAFDWNNSKLRFQIGKSPDKYAEFPLLAEVSTAVIDYFRSGRPLETESKNVFVRHVAPYCEFGNDNNLHGIISKYMNLAGLSNFNHRKRGLHSLRHSIAGNMLDNGVPLPVVSEILCHSSTQTTMIYTKISSKQLSMCPLEVD